MSYEQSNAGMGMVPCKKDCRCDDCKIESQAKEIDGLIELLRQEKVKVEELEGALEKLARLGNEPHYGNSTGNKIAIAALKDGD